MRDENSDTMPQSLTGLWRALSRLEAEERAAIDDAREGNNAFAIPSIALLASILFFIFWLGTFVGIMLDRSAPLRPVYLGLFAAETAVSALYFLGRSVFGRRSRGPYLIVSLAGVVALNLLGMHEVGDRSIYLMALMTCALLYSGPRRWYLVVFPLTWLASVAGMALWYPGIKAVRDAVILATIVLLSTAVGLTLELRRAAAAILSLRLSRKNEELREISVRDPLTGLYNRRFLLEWLRQALARTERQDEPGSLTLAIADLDRLKVINDNAGHKAGDAALKAAAETFRQQLRRSDVIARYGGDEFVIAMPDAPEDEARHAMERALAAFAKVRIPDWESPLSFSCGIAVWQPGQDEAGLISAADERLYSAKEAGRSRIA